jgi:SRSO17 transposase
MTGLMSDLPRKNGWTIAEHVGDRTPDRTQRLLNQAVWDHEQAQGVVRRFVVEQLGDQPLRVGALDESGQEKQGEHTAGAKRQYMGCAGRVANGVNTVYCSYATPGGHALVAARIYVPEEQLADTEHRVALGIPAEVEFKTKSQLARDIIADMIADESIPPWIA